MMINKSEQGRTMIETIMVISIIGVLALGAIKVANTVLDRFRMSKIGNQIIDIRKAIGARYMSAGRYDGLKVEDLIEEGILPRDTVKDSSTLAHAYGGAIRIKESGTTYKVTFINLNKPVCTELGLLNWTFDDTSDLVQMEINGDTYIWDDDLPTGSNTFLLPASLTDVFVSCEEDQNSITWEFE